jgi:hypothetical protein
MKIANALVEDVKPTDQPQLIEWIFKFFSEP